ncbi:MAG: hypothetical protein COB66_08070, partial [Coxiella sp. (in: Bacteria)]
TDKEPALYGAVENVFGDYTTHRDNKYMNNCIEQSHREIKSRYRPMKGFQDSWCAMIFCTVFEETKQFFRMNNKTQSQRRKAAMTLGCRFIFHPEKLFYLFKDRADDHRAPAILETFHWSVT